MSDARAPSEESAALDALLREVVETLAPIDRTPCSAGEREAAEWLAARLREMPGVEVALEDEHSWGTFPPTATALGLLGVLAAALVLRGRRASGGLAALASFAGIVDEAQNGPQLVRRLLRRRRRTVNLVARLGARDAPYTLVVIAHHDAPQSGVLFDQTLQRRLYERAPQVLERFKTPLPQWWIGLAGELATMLAALSARRGYARAGLAIGLLGTAAVADIWVDAGATYVDRAAVLARAGAAITGTAADTLEVTGLSAARIVEVLSQAAVPFSEVSAHRATLEQAYLDLTRDQVEFRADPVGEVSS